MSLIRQLRHVLAGFLILAGTAFAQQDLRIAPARDRDIAPRLVVTGAVEQPVRLESVSISVELLGGLAQTDVLLVFRNPNRRVLEGELQFPLLDGQQVTAFALDVDGRMRDAVPVEKDKGRQVFEDIARRGIDPGLLEATQGNNYKLRIYPLPAQGTRSVRLRIAEALTPRASGRVYRLALAYGDSIPRFSLAIRARGVSTPPAVAWRNPDDIRFVQDQDGFSARLERHDYLATGFLEVTTRLSGPLAWAGEFGAARYFFAELPLRGASAPRRLPKSIALVWDSSASGAQRHHAREFALLDAYFSRFGEGMVQLQRVRETASAPEEFRITGGNWRVLRHALEQTVYDGATNLGALTPLAGAEESLLFSDGLANFGEAVAPRLAGRVYAISSAARANSAFLKLLAEAAGGQFIDLLADTRSQAADKLLKSAPRLLHVDADGAREVIAASPYPRGGYLNFAGILEGNGATLKVTVELPGGATQTRTLPIPKSSQAGDFPARLWARMRVDALQAEPSLHRAEIRRLGKAFGLVTRETSLIVLERIEDYARNEIVPPAELRDAYERLLASAAQRRSADRQQHLERIVRLFQDKQAWWNRAFPKDARSATKDDQHPPIAGALREEQRALRQRRDAPASAPAPASSALRAETAKSAGAAQTLARNAASAAEASPAISIQLKRWTPDAAYFRRLQQAAAKDLYAVYLDERQEHSASTAYYLDAADIFLERGERALGIRILSNLAEMDLENRHVLRILGYRLMQAAEPRLAIPVFKRVLELSPEEPQSYRDLGLAYAATGQAQLAVDTLHEVVVRPWHGRFPEIELITLAELNSIVARAKDGNGTERPDTSRIDPRLLQNLPLDLRVVLSWDADNTDIDLWVTDPNGEKAFYGNRLSYQGGRMSQDFTGGYGPEEFSLRNAKPGRYKIEAQFYGNRQQIVAGATTLQLKLATRFGTPVEAEKIVTLRLKGKSEVVLVGEFEVK